MKDHYKSFNRRKKVLIGSFLCMLCSTGNIMAAERAYHTKLVAEGFRWENVARWAAADELIVGQRPKGFKAAQVDENPFPVDADGFLDPFQKAIPNGYGFKLDRDYLNSVPESEIVLNPALTQNPGW